MKKFNDYYEAINEADRTFGENENSTHVYKDLQEKCFIVLTKGEAKALCDDCDRFYLVY